MQYLFKGPWGCFCELTILGVVAKVTEQQFKSEASIEGDNNDIVTEWLQHSFRADRNGLVRFVRLFFLTKLMRRTVAAATRPHISGTRVFSFVSRSADGEDAHVAPHLTISPSCLLTSLVTQFRASCLSCEHPSICAPIHNRPCSLHLLSSYGHTDAHVSIQVA